jgi:hypothetical protein
MQCESCRVCIKSEFIFAIQSNQCPACGKQIMQASKLASFLSLKSLLDDSLKDKNVDIDKLAAIIIANFELKQIFKEEFQNLPKESIINNEIVINNVEEENVDPVFDSDGIKYEKPDQKKYKNILQKMRDEVLSEALDDRDIDLTDDDMLLLSDENMRQEYMLRQKREEARQAMISGKSSVRRSG